MSLTAGKFAARLRAAVIAIACALGFVSKNAQPADIAEQTRSLYRSVVVVTGQSEENRIPGFAQCFADVLVKVSGDPTVIEDKKFPALAAEARTFVQSFKYRDLLEGKPIHDEQGTYDRPHYLTVTFDPAKIDALLRALGREPWLPPRPRVAVFLGVENVKATFMLASDSTADRSEDMRGAFAAAAAKAGMAAGLPKLSELQAHGWTAATLLDAPAAELAAIARSEGEDVALAGKITFSEQALGWIAAWRLEHQGRTYTWGIRGVNFDAAFRDAIFGAAQILSGHGQPQIANP